MNGIGSLGVIEAVVIGLLCAVLFSGAFVGLLLRARRQRRK
jgi:hypothetical protein